MTLRAPRAATYADLQALPPEVTGQILDGELIALPRPTLGHANAATGLTGELFGPFQRGRGGPGGWHLLFEPELHLGADVVVPDVASWRRERLPELPSAAFIELAPDWVCEVLSPGTEHIDRGRKRVIYERERVAWWWLLDPEEKLLEVLSLTPDGFVIVDTFGGDDVVRAAPFEAIEIALGALWLG